MKFNGKTYLIEGRNSIDSWARAIKMIGQQSQEIVAGEDYEGHNILTKDVALMIVLDEEAVEEIAEGIVHPAFKMGKESLNAYNEQFTYKFARSQWVLPDKMKFSYDYFSRMINYPIPFEYRYQGNLLEFDIPERYFCKNDNNEYTGGIDQLKIIHDQIRNDGISRRHQIVTWISGIDLFSKSPPCLQTITLRVLVPKDEWKNYPDGIPIAVYVYYRSWDIYGGLPANLYGIVNCLQRYVLGNLNEENEYVNNVLNPYNKIDFKIDKLYLFTNFGHVYQNDYPVFSKV